jgi:hypothetical protein
MSDVERLARMTDDELRKVWSCLDAGSDTEWMQNVYSEMSRRGVERAIGYNRVDFNGNYY